MLTDYQVVQLHLTFSQLLETDYEFMESLTGHEVLQHEACELTVLLNHERPKVRLCSLNVISLYLGVLPGHTYLFTLTYKLHFVP